MTKIIYIKGYENHLFKEGSGYIVQYLRESKHKVKVKNTIKKILNSYKVNIRFKTNKEICLKEENLQKNKELFSEEKTHLKKPFIDKKNQMIKVRKNTTFFKRIVGYSDGSVITFKDDIKISCQK